MDQLWLNLRYTMIAMSTSLIVKYLGAYFSADQAGSISEAIVGAVFLVGTYAWGNYVKFRTKSVPIATAARADVPTVSAGTGAIEH